MYDKLFYELSNESESDSNEGLEKVIKSIKKVLNNHGSKRGVVSELAGMFKNLCPDFVSELDSNPYLVAFTNGVYDLRAHTFRDATPEDLLSLTTGYPFHEYSTETPEYKEILAFLGQIFCDKDILQFTLDTLGKSLCGITDEEFFIWTGIRGSNGKSTLVNLLESVFGGYHASIDIAAFTNKRVSSSNASPELVRLRGKRLVTTQEPESSDRLNTGIMKSWTGGDSIVGRELFKNSIEFKLQSTFVMCCNDLPILTSNDGGVTRRLRVVDFKSRFCDVPNPKVTTEFKKIDKNELRVSFARWTPVFMWILIGRYVALDGKYVKVPAQVSLANIRYSDTSNQFEEFINSKLYSDSASFMSLLEIYNVFIGYFESTHPKSKMPSSKRLENALNGKFGLPILKDANSKIRIWGYSVSINQDGDGFDMDFDGDIVVDATDEL